MEQTATSAIRAESWVGVRSERPFFLYGRLPGVALAGPPCPTAYVEGRIGSFAADTLRFNSIVPPRFTADAPSECSRYTDWYLVGSASPSLEFSTPRFDRTNTAAVVLMFAVFVGAILTDLAL